MMDGVREVCIPADAVGCCSADRAIAVVARNVRRFNRVGGLHGWACDLVSGAMGDICPSCDAYTMCVCVRMMLRLYRMPCIDKGLGQS